MYYDIKSEQISDGFGGLEDLKNKTLKCIGKAEDRFTEDHLRILRALRLAHQLNFKIEVQTQQALMAQKHKIKKLAKERILKELNKMFRVGRWDLSLPLLKQQALWEILFPGLELLPLNPVEESDFVKNKEAVRGREQKIFRFYQQSFSCYDEEAFCWTALALPFFYKDKKNFQAFLNTYPLPTATRKQALSYWLSLQTLIQPDSLFADKLIAFNNKAQQVYELTKALIKSKILSFDKLDFYFKEFKKRAPNNQLAPALVTGKDLLNLSPPIKKQHFSQYLRQAYRLQIENPKWKKSQILKNLFL